MISFEDASRSRQRGWVGLVGLLIALVIVGMLLKTVLQQYGLSGTTGTASKATPVDSVSHDVTTTEVTPRNAMEQARGLQSAVQQQAVDNAKRIDDALKK
jgi:hypothetical protein